MSEHPSLNKIKKRIAVKPLSERLDRTQNIIESFEQQLGFLKNQYRELKELDLTVSSLKELTDSSNGVSDKLDKIISMLEGKGSEGEDEILSLLKSKLTEKRR